MTIRRKVSGNAFQLGWASVTDCFTGWVYRFGVTYKTCLADLSWACLETQALGVSLW